MTVKIEDLKPAESKRLDVVYNRLVHLEGALNGVKFALDYNVEPVDAADMIGLAVKELGDLSAEVEKLCFDIFREPQDLPVDDAAGAR